MLKAKVPLAQYTTLKVGGSAEWFGVVETVEEVETAARFAQQSEQPFRVIGSGSNLLVPDAGFAGVVVQNSIKGISYHHISSEQVEITVGAGEVLDEVIVDTVQRGYWGLENLSAIPGTVGATPIQNVGAYGVEVADLITKVTCYQLSTATIVTLLHNECQFSYRDSLFKSPAGKDYVIVSVTFLLSKQAKPQIMYADLARTLTPQADQNIIRTTITEIRSQKFPDWRVTGTAGSFFKNPIIPIAHAQKLQVEYPNLPVFPVSPTMAKVSLGYILDKVCGLKGYTKNGVSLYAKQALVLVNEQPSASTILTFAQEVTDIVFKKTNIIIEREVTDLL